MWLQPDGLSPSVESISPDFLRAMQCRVLLLDADNTLMPHGRAEVSQAVWGWIAGLLEAGVPCALLSNAKQGRAKRLAEKLNLPYIGHARKPSVWGVQEACKLFGVLPREIVVVGDQLFTDIWCARRAGARSILVRPISHEEPVYIRLKRILEGWVLPLGLRSGMWPKQCICFVDWIREAQSVAEWDRK